MGATDISERRTDKRQREKGTRRDMASYGTEAREKISHSTTPKDHTSLSDVYTPLPRDYPKEINVCERGERQRERE